MTQSQDAIFSKVPAVTLGFWIIKILATTLGETGGDSVTMSWLNADQHPENGGYLIGTGLFLVVFIAAVIAQITRKTFNPWIYWLAIVASTTVGTAMADFFDLDRHRLIPRRVHCGRDRANHAQDIQSLDLLAGHRRLDDGGHGDGGFFRSLARHRLCRRLDGALALRHRQPRQLVLVGRHDRRQHGEHAADRSLLLADYHFLANPRHGARRLGGRYRFGLWRRRGVFRHRPPRPRRLVLADPSFAGCAVLGCIYPDPPAWGYHRRFSRQAGR